MTRTKGRKAATGGGLLAGIGRERFFVLFVATKRTNYLPLSTPNGFKCAPFFIISKCRCAPVVMCPAPCVPGCPPLNPMM